MESRQLFDPESSSYSYLIWDTDSREAALIDPVQEQVDRDIRLVRELGLILRYTLETHVHADHITGSGKLRNILNSIMMVHENRQ
jgi:glyoxylase-like metal-dependent hydrolase (beta-lactamase superfamily II)